MKSSRKEKGSDRRSQLKSQQDRHTENDSKGYGGRTFITVDEGTDFYKISSAKNEFDILPWIIKTKNHPGGLEPGDAEYCLDISIHQNIGVNNDRFICLKKTYGKPCPICEERANLAQLKGWKDPVVQSLAPSRKGIMWVLDHLEKDEDKEIKIFIASWASLQYNGFVPLLLEVIADAEAESGKDIIVADLAEGKTISFDGREVKGGDFNNYKDYTVANPRKFKLLDRDEPLEEDLWDKITSLDSLLIVPTYEEVYASLHMTDDDKVEEEKEEEEEEERQPRRKSKPEPEEDDRKEELSEEEKEEERRQRIRETREKKTKSEPEKEANKCSYGHKWGKDHDETEDCSKCNDWDECWKEEEE